MRPFAQLMTVLTTIALFGALPVHAQFNSPNTPVHITTPQEAIAQNEIFRTQMQEGLAGCAVEEAEACHLTAELYRKGHGITQSYAKATNYYRKGCMAGGASSCAGLAYLYNRGDGMDAPNFAQARHFFKTACDLGEVTGCAGYGNLLYVGKGGRKDTRGGTRYLQQACDREYDWACQRLSDLGAYERDPNWKGSRIGKWITGG